MSRNTLEPDFRAALAILEPGEREAVLGFADTLALTDWTACPPLRGIVVAVAALRLSADVHPALSPTAKLREATAALGCGPDSGTIAASIGRQIRRWASADKMSTLDVA